MLNPTSRATNHSEPFTHSIVSDFFLPDIACEIAKGFAALTGAVEYDNAAEVKHALHDWQKVRADDI